MTLIGIAIGVFVVLVSAQVFHDWPIAALGGQGQKAAVAPAKALPTSAGSAAGATAVPRGTTRPAATDAAGRRQAHHRAAPAGPTDTATGPAEVVATDPDPGATGDESPSGATSGPHHPQSSSSSPSSPSSDSGSSGSSGSAGSGSTATGSSGSGGSGGPGTDSPVTTSPVTAATKPVQVVTGVVDETVGGVDEKVLGGTLEKAGVTQVSEEVVNGVAGPESPVGKTVDGVGEAVGGLLGGGH